MTIDITTRPHLHTDTEIKQLLDALYPNAKWNSDFINTIILDVQSRCTALREISLSTLHQSTQGQQQQLSTLQEEYIKTLPGTVGHVYAKANNDGISDKAFCDLFVMSQAKKIISIVGENIYGGSFSKAAAYIGNVPFVRYPLAQSTDEA